MTDELRFETQDMPSDTEQTGRLLIAVAGVTLSMCMIIGSLAPWVRASRLTFSGWLGVGIPVVFAAFIALGLHVIHVFVPKRPLLVGSLLIGVAGVLAAVVVCLLVWSFSGATGLIVSLIARGLHRQAFAGGSISIGWGIPVLGFSSFLLALLSFAALVSRFGSAPSTRARARDTHAARVALSRAQRTSQAPLSDGGEFDDHSGYSLPPDVPSGLDLYR